MESDGVGLMFRKELRSLKKKIQFFGKRAVNLVHLGNTRKKDVIY